MCEPSGWVIRPLVDIRPGPGMWVISSAIPSGCPWPGWSRDRTNSSLDLIPTARFLPGNPILSKIDGPLSLPPVDLPNLSPASSPSILQIWQDGLVVTAPQTFGYRETILVTLDPALATSSGMSSSSALGLNQDMPSTPCVTSATVSCSWLAPIGLPVIINCK